MMRQATIILAALALPASTLAAQADAIKKLPASFGVPSSPAFELLPSKPDEVTHIATPRDLQANSAVFFDGKKLRTGIAIDGRPFTYAVGSLTDYQKSLGHQVLWRTVFSFGTAAAEEGSDDMLIAAGVRLPIVDRSDPRADKAFINDLQRVADSVIASLPPPGFEDDREAYDVYGTIIEKKLEPLREAKAKSSWGAFKLDLGMAGSGRAPNSSIEPDSLRSDRGGIWIAAERKLLGFLWTASAKGVAMRRSADTVETGRRSVGLRLGLKPRKYFGFSVEATAVRSLYADSTALNEDWGHYAAIMEFPAPFLNGWVALAYGGDSKHRTGDNKRLSLQYAVFKDRILPKP